MTASVCNLFEKLEEPSLDVIFALTARYQAAKKAFDDGSISKSPINLGVGKFVNEDGKTPLLNSIQTAIEIAKFFFQS